MYVIYISISEVLIVLSACFMDWLFEIGAGVCDMMTGCLIGLPGCLFLGPVLSWQWEPYIEAAG
jgi:hypothetical protein